MAPVQILLCGGMPRSASTWSFNVCRELMQALRPERHGTWAGFINDGDRLDTDVDGLPPGPIYVIKSHEPGPRTQRLAAEYGAGVITLRDPIRATASVRSFFARTLAEAVISVTNSLKTVEAAASLGGTLFVGYTALGRDHRGAVAAIADHLVLRGLAEPHAVTEDLVDRVAAATSIERFGEITSAHAFRSGADIDTEGRFAVHAETLLHQGHVDRGPAYRWERELDADELALLRDHFGPWRRFFEDIGCAEEAWQL